MLNWKSMRVLALTLTVLLMLACEAVNTKVGGALNLDTNLKLEFIVDSDINPDEGGTPSPLYIRLYELKATKMVERADFINLYEADAEALGADLVAKQELRRLTPGEGAVERFVLGKETKYVALYAEFFQYKNARYKIVFPVTSNNIIRNAIKVRVSANNISLVK